MVAPIYGFPAPQIELLLLQKHQRGWSYQKGSVESRLCQFSKGNISQTAPGALSRVSLPKGRPTRMMQTAKHSISKPNHCHILLKMEYTATQDNYIVPFPHGQNYRLGEGPYHWDCL